MIHRGDQLFEDSLTEGDEPKKKWGHQAFHWPIRLHTRTFMFDLPSIKNMQGKP